MKKIALLAVAVVMSICMYAYDNTRLIVSTTTTQNYYLFIDGYAVGDQYKNGSSYYISDINSANHRIQLYKQSSSIFGGNNRKLVYDNTIFLKTNTETTLSVNMFGNVVINETPLGNGGWNGGNNGGWNGGNNNNNNGSWNNNNQHQGHDCDNKRGKGHKKHKKCGNGNSWNNNNGSWNNNSAINDKSFYQLKQSIQNESFDDTKKSIALQGMRNNYFTSAQVKELVQLFTFESSKLDIAKQGYKNVVDKQNYFAVSDVFTFSSSKQELMQYIQTVG
ncbi:MAG: DUF4476 domain-containing protein [Ferruginibacter sp.]|nr:DUF4476 domain-containing protein [Ferruginibacter sp.]